MTEQHETPGGVSGKALQRDIPQATVTRLATYLRVLAGLADEGVAIVSSEELAVAAGVNSAKLRKDLSFLGPNGVRGVGYDVAKLRTRIEDVLGLSQGHRVVLIGAGNLGRALVGYGGFGVRGFTVVGIFDNDSAVIGQSYAGLVVRDVEHLTAQIPALAPTIAVLAVPDEAAQDVCDRLVAVGLPSILSFAPCELRAPAHVEVRRVDLAMELQMLSFDAARNDAPALPEVAQAGSGRIARRVPAPNHPALTHPAPVEPARGRPTRRTAPHSATPHSATEPSTKGSVITP
ncbi:redox-sensing transcriptional repressor Rex [Nocardia asteroides]|uniref:Redox-sensing transcriptional repressor Rex n=1 Tax=Nocardia asteroides NBRC 15531 TaxID=1110697 RepID=U5E458_NOCAS|nr:redox-sensing transcriptional repressor Rex [Nocardia asteroides]TLF69635.1 redox-sensing transcriptional repressor Rex [Nocardia asteroides NBRC 15531]UGT49136.1 redox-sensing transcriptional repressor Rex [Nocardia asteroides]SFL81489.1 redox-sensing transcriptional repressor [Nocardia asteroides]VEG31073.1 Redox-sensing transcriptional repressor rex [Nocardia asteroides]GAD83707.1 redox-sensing transcriptional repressor Rex [Nocardia asteroides NBRC 15531]